MKNDTPPTLTVICCAVFKAEILVLRERHWSDLVVHFLNSMLHMRPDKLARSLDKQLKENLLGQNALLIYGDCCMQMEDFTKRPGVVRVRGNNCCDLLLGSKRYRQLSHEGAFFLFPEWAKRWHHIFSTELGLNKANARSLMGEMHQKLVYLDTGVLPVPTDDLNKCSQYCGLPWEALTVSLEPLRTEIQTALDNFNTRKDCE